MNEAMPMGAPDLRLQMLVVDDDDVDRERVRRLLVRSPLDAEVTEAASGAEALELVRDRAFDCVVLDNQLGDASGSELLAELRRQACKDCPIIMVTGAGNEALAVRVMLEGASDYLAKTQLSADGLQQAVRRSMEHHRVRHELAMLHQQLEERVEQQAATLRQRERDLRALINNTPAVMGSWDRDQRCRFGNPTHSDWFGPQVQPLPGRPLHEVLGDELYTQAIAAIEAALRGCPQQVEWPIAARRGLPARHAQVQLQPELGEDGTVLGFYATLTDVTLIKQVQARAEELLRFSDAVIENSPIGIAVFSAEGACVIANAAFAAALGETQAMLRNRDFRQQPAWRACGLVDEAQATLADGLPRRRDLVLPHAAGHEVPLACALARVDRNGEPQLLLIAQDISERRLAETAIITARDAAESAARTKSDFLANMSHEIRTPMNAIVGLSRLALEDELPASARDYLDKVHTSAVALMGILDDVLDYSKMDAGRLSFETIAFDLDTTLGRVVDLFQARIEQKGLAIAVDIAAGVPRRLMGDPLRLSQVLSNLVGNAIKFTETGHIRLRVDIEGAAADASGELLKFSVQDTGIGIPAGLAGTLFQAFVQGDGSITRRFGGTGLGLAICKRLVEMMGGHIGVESQPGQGSLFWFTARLAPTAAASDIPSTPPPPALAAAEPARARLLALRALAAPLQGAQVLLAEDNRLNQIVAREMLQRVGLNVTVVDDGAQALEAIRSAAPGHYRLVLMDLHMPVVDGLEATRRIHALPGGRSTVVIGMTAAALPEDRARCLAAGMVDHIPKPLIAEHVIRTLVRWSADPAPTAAADRTAAAEGAGLPPLTLDLEALRARLHGNETVLWKLLSAFATFEANAVKTITGLLADGEYEAARRKAHDLKGSAANLGAMAISSASAALEAGLLAGRSPDAALSDLARQLDHGLSAIRQALADRD